MRGIIMTQKDSKYIALLFLTENTKDQQDKTEVILSGNTIDEVMNWVEWWFGDYVEFYDLDVDTIREAHHIDNTICIGDFQFLIYKREAV